MSELELSDGLPGFRLDAMELYNWGTFGRMVWSFPFGCGNALVTGDIGSGKSTWVDALSTLIVPPQKLTYNKAAGAERRERTDKSYVLGEFRSARDEAYAAARPVYLRDEGSYSVILAVFKDGRDARLLSLAQLRWIKGGEVQRLYVCSGRRLSTLKDFADFSGDGATFKKRLRQTPNTEAFDSYSDYAASFKAAMGMGDKAVELFNQTVSMKTIGDLDDFIRGHMLEPTGAAERVRELLKNFDTLRAAHDAVESCRLQRDALLPIRDEGREHLELVAQKERLELMAQALPFYAIARLIPLLEKEIGRLDTELRAAEAERDRVRDELSVKREDESRLRSAIDNSEAGRRLTELEAELGRAAEERDRRKGAQARYREPLAELGIPLPASAAAFGEARARLASELSAIESKRQGLSDERDRLYLERSEQAKRVAEIEDELASLRGRTNAIPARAARLRDELAAALGLEPEELPFAGQFMRVAKDQRAWEGAAERALRRLALSVLVPEGRHKELAAWADERPLGSRLRFLRAPDEAPATPRLGARALARAIELKPDAPSRALLESELAKAAPHERCDSLEEFHRFPDAALRSGLLKSGKIAYEKDDEQESADPRRFVLGWSNADKIALLERDRADAARAKTDAEASLAAAERAVAAAARRRELVVDALRFEDWDELDLDAATKRYAALKAERDELERSSDQLYKLKEAWEAIKREIAAFDRALQERNAAIGGIESQARARRLELEEYRSAAAAAPEAAEYYQEIEGYLRGVGLPLGPSLADHGSWQAETRRRLESRRNTVERRDSDLRTSLQRRMLEFLARYPEREAELEAKLGAIEGYIALLSRIEGDDLPAYEGRFRQLLRESTLRDIALFQTELDEDAQAIKRAIDAINEPLAAVEYNPGTYICLAAERREDPEVRDFRAELRRCLENTLGDDELYSEDKFTRVKALLARLAGESAADRAWAERVTDARSWFTFTASERYKEDGSEKEFYSSSSGKSGGQKEKLAYTILASALAYQYRQGGRAARDGVARDGVARDRGGFRLVVIDEAFGRGSEESTRYGLRLFESLGLQLVLVTPLQKIGVIEGSVETIHLVTNPTGRESELRTIGIKEYREGKARRAVAAAPGVNAPPAGDGDAGDGE